MTPLEKLALAIAAVAVLAFALRGTPFGRRVAGWLAVRRSAPAAPAAAPVRADPGEDHDFLLARCNGDEDEVFRRLEAEVRRNPSLSEAEAYRRAIRTWFVEKRGGTHGTIAEELDDTWL